MKKFLVFVFGATLLSACSSESEKIHLRTEKGPREKAAIVKGNTLLTVNVEGMTCEMGCGGSIRKELKASGAVERVEFVDFKEDADVQTAKITFDNTKISAAEIEKIVRTMNDKQFTVSNPTVEKIAGSDEAQESSVNKENESATVELAEESFVFPNLINILKDFVVN